MSVWDEPVVDPPHPCVARCGVSSQNGFCTGCYMTLVEIKEWQDMSIIEHNEVVKRCNERKALLLPSTNV